MSGILKRCTKCYTKKPTSEFYDHSTTRDGFHHWCKSCMANKNRGNYRLSTPRRKLFISSNNNAASKGLEHTITIDDIPMPEVCKYLGVVIAYYKVSEKGKLRSFDAPSIDRIDSTRGYVPGNIQVISDLANRMKSNATIDQLVAFAEGVLRVHKS